MSAAGHCTVDHTSAPPAVLTLTCIVLWPTCQVQAGVENVCNLNTIATLAPAAAPVTEGVTERSLGAQAPVGVGSTVGVGVGVSLMLGVVETLGVGVVDSAEVLG